tara:strand:- start:2371 stop:2511 length:141 start_codon:yes stop_codon:yes gene_type:complete
VKEFADEKIVRYGKIALAVGLTYGSTYVFGTDFVIIALLFYIAYNK